MDLPLILELAAAAGDDRIAVGSADSGLSYAGLQDMAARSAAWILERGVKNVCTVAENSVALPITLFGSATARVPFAPINYRLTDDRLDDVLARLAPAVAVVDDSVVGRVAPEGVELVRQSDYLAALRSTDPLTSPPAGDVDGVAVVLYTSGTTGPPKAAILRHSNLASYVFSTIELMGAEPDEAAIVTTPPYHVAAIAGILTAVFSGRRIVYLRTFDPENWVATVRAELITHAMVVPTMVGRILDVVEASGEGMPSLRHLSYGGGPMPVSVVERALTLLPGVDLVNAYGLTETSSTISLLGPEDHRIAFASEDPAVRQRLQSVGRPIPGLEVAVLDDVRQPVRAGEWGEVALRGDQVSGEYTGVANDGSGWFYTRDRGMFDADGFLYLGGRLDDVIVRGGENLSPGSIEDALLAHPAVSGAAVIGAPSEEWGEEPVAFVIAVGVDEATLKAWVRERLRSASTPTAVFFREDLPYSETGKLLRRELRDALAQLQTPS